MQERLFGGGGKVRGWGGGDVSGCVSEGCRVVLFSAFFRVSVRLFMRKAFLRVPEC